MGGGITASHWVAANVHEHHLGAELHISMPAVVAANDMTVAITAGTLRYTCEDEASRFESVFVQLIPNRKNQEYDRTTPGRRNLPASLSTAIS